MDETPIRGVDEIINDAPEYTPPDNDEPDNDSEAVTEAKAVVADLAEKTKADAGAPFEPDMMKALLKIRAHDPALFHRLRGDLKKLGVPMRDFNRELSKYNFRVIRGGAAGGDGATERAGPYKMVNGVICHEKRTQDGPVTLPLCNFDARIIGEEIRDDGAERNTVFEIEGTLQGGKALPIAEVPADRYASMNWVTASWGTRAVLNAGMGTKDHLRCAIQLLSGEVPRRTVFAHLGWRKFGEEWFYLHGGGAIGPHGPDRNVQVQPSDSRLAYYALPDPPSGEELKASIHASLSVLELAPTVIVYPLLAAVYRAPLGEVAPLDLTIFLAGPTGSQKTEITAMAQAHYGAGFHGACLPGNWATTGNALEKRAFLAKDAVFTVDDFAPAGTTADVQRLHRDADRLIRGQGNRAGRGRMRPDGTARPEYFPRGIVVSSGEDIPRGQSLRARTLILEISKGDIDLARLTRAQDAAGRGQFARAMSSYVQWLAPQIETLKSDMPARLLELRAEARQHQINHDRTPDIVASLAAGVEMFLRFAHAAQAIDLDQQASFQDQCWQSLLLAAETQAGHQANEEPVARFLALLASAITSGQAHIADATRNDAPEDAGAWGWRKKEYVSGGIEREEWQPKGSLVGWLEGDELLLDPEAAFAAAQRLAREQGGGLLITAQTLWKRMAEQGKLVSRDEQRERLTARRTICGRRRAVINIFADTLLCSVTVPTVPTGPQTSNSAALRAINLGRLSGDEEKPSHKSGPKSAENGGDGPIGTVGTVIGDKGPPPEEIISDGGSAGPEEPAAIDGGEI